MAHDTSAPPKAEFETVPLKGLPFVGLVLVGLIIAVASNRL